MAYLNAEEVHSYYGPSHVLQGVTMSVEKGRIAVLLGRNGMGKTTLMRAITGLTPARGGEIVFDGTRIRHLKPYQIFDLGIGYVPQGRHMFPYLTVQENLRMGLRQKRLRHPDVFDRLFTYFPVLRERLKQKAGTLSGGEQQQLAIARALAGDVSMMLLDEPTEGIQPSVVDEILELLVQINRHENLTILLVEQNMELALDIAEDYFVMAKGVIVESGPVAGIDKEGVISKYLVV